LAPLSFLAGISANQVAGNIRVTGSYKTWRSRIFVGKRSASKN